MPLTIRQIPFDHPDFSTIFNIRVEVFVAEQNVPLEEERDAHDPAGLHLLAELDGEPAGTARVLMKGEDVKITRVAVLRAARGKRVGEALMRHVEAMLPNRRYVLNGQIQAQPFYERLGYRPVGEMFMEGGIPHLHMVKDGR